MVNRLYFQLFNHASSLREAATLHAENTLHYMFVIGNTQLDLCCPSGPELICRGQIVCKGEKCELLSGCCGPHTGHLYLSQAPPDSCSSHSWEREAISKQFHPTTPSCPPSIRQLPSWTVVNFQIHILHTEAMCMCIPGMESTLSCFVLRSSGSVEGD